MSEMTRCNYCTLQDIKARYPSKEVTLERTPDGWLRVMVDGVRIGHTFLAVSEGCVC